MSVTVNGQTIEDIYYGSAKIASVYKGTQLVYGQHQVILSTSDPSVTSVTIPFTGDFRVTAIGAGGRANYRCVYDDRGYIGCGGSGAGYSGTLHLEAGTYNIQIGSCVAGAARDTIITGVLTVGGGGDGTSGPSGGAAGAAPVVTAVASNVTLNTAGNAGGAYSSGNGGGGATWNYGGATSVYEGHGRGGGGKVCEYASTSSANEASGEPFNPTNGFLKIEV